MALSVSVSPGSFPTAFTCPAGCWPERGKNTCLCERHVASTKWSGMLRGGNGLGIIPSYQFHAGPPENPEGYGYTKHLQFTADVPNQLTVQPVGPYVTSGDAQLQGLGITMVQNLPPAAAGAGISGVFDSWWWKNRKYLAVGALSLLGLAIAGAATGVLR